MNKPAGVVASVVGALVVMTVVVDSGVEGGLTVKVTNKAVETKVRKGKVCPIIRYRKGNNEVY